MLKLETYGNGLVVYGQTFDHKQQLKSHGGKFNRHLNLDGVLQAGWIFPKNKYDDLQTLIASTTPTPTSTPTSTPTPTPTPPKMKIEIKPKLVIKFKVPPMPTSENKTTPVIETKMKEPIVNNPKGEMNFLSIMGVLKEHPFVREKMENLLGLSDKNNISIINAETLTRLFSLYEQQIFNGTITQQLNDLHLGMTFKISDKMTSSAGSFKIKDGTCFITISGIVMKNINMDRLRKGLIVSSGLIMHTLLQALMTTFEHELIHMIIRIFTSEVDQSHGPLFKQLIQYFGHTSITHELFGTNPMSTQTVLHESPKYAVENTVVYQGFKRGQPIEIRGRIVKLDPVNAKVICDDRSIYSIRYHALKKV